MNTTAHLDYIAVTCPLHISTSAVHRVLLKDDPLKPTTKRRMKNYVECFENESGVAFFVSESHKQGNLLILTGQPLSEARERGCSDSEMVGHINSFTQKFTRLDVALNLHDSYLTPGTVERWYKAKKILTKAHAGRRIYSLEKEGDTLYLGSRRSDRFLRIYDKAADMKLPDTAWVRVELETHRRQARALAYALADEPNARAVMNLAIRNFIEPPPRTDLDIALSDLCADIEPVRRKEPNLTKWMHDQIAPAFVAYERDHPGFDSLALLKAFMADLR